MTALASLIVFAHCAVAVGGGWYFFRNHRLKRPPIGIFNLWDVGSMMLGIVIIPYLYLALPKWGVGALLGLGAFSILTLVLEQLLPPRVGYGVALLGCVLNVVFVVAGAPTISTILLNNLVQVLVVIGATNLWAQSGMRARDVTILGAGLFVYDLLFTTFLPLMTELFELLAGLPFAPVVAWQAGDGQRLAIGLGDILLATLFPLVMRKAFGRGAGYGALGISLVALALVLALPALGLLRETFPVMVVLSPLMIAQYVFWRQRRGRERTTQQYLRAG